MVQNDLEKTCIPYLLDIIIKFCQIKNKGKDLQTHDGF